MKRADVAAMWDVTEYNSGFIAVKPTIVGKQLYRTMKSTSIEPAAQDDQRALNNALLILRQQNVRLNVATLDKRRFLNGLAYFETQLRRFAPKDDGQKCDRMKQTDCAVVIHNNWIVSRAAKVYRLREHLMWLLDGDDQYYTSKTRLYLTYANQAPTLPHVPLDKNSHTAVEKSEIAALRTAMMIGYLLNRTVILPRFHCGPMADESPLNSLLHVRSFDDEFAGQYRENSFLRHPKVPPDVKSGLPKQQLVEGKSDNGVLLLRKGSVSGVDVVRQFGVMKDRVLTFHSLLGVNVVLGNSSEEAAFNQKLGRAFFQSGYRQLTRW